MHVKDKGMYKKDGINDCDQACATHVLHQDGHYVCIAHIGERLLPKSKAAEIFRFW